MLTSNVTLGPFRVDKRGLLSPADAARFPRFGVRWRNRLIHAKMAQLSPHDHRNGTLALFARIGRVPSTASSTLASVTRVSLLRLLKRMPRTLPEGWKLHLTPDHSVVIETQLNLVLPISAITLVTQMSLFLLSLSPYLDVLEADGIGLATGSDRI